MKRGLAILFILAFVFQSTHSLWTLVSFYIHREYISQNLCVNRFDAMPVCKGQCYLEKKLEENSKREHKLPDHRDKEVQLFFQNSSSTEFTSFSPFNKRKKFTPNHRLSITLFTGSLDRPPEFV